MPNGMYGQQAFVAKRTNIYSRTGSPWLRVNPPGFRRILNYIKDTTNNVPVYVTENGVTDNNGTVRDQHRISYYNDYINELLKGSLADFQHISYSENTYFITVAFYTWNSYNLHQFQIMHLPHDQNTHLLLSTDTVTNFLKPLTCILANY